MTTTKGIPKADPLAVADSAARGRRKLLRAEMSGKQRSPGELHSHFAERLRQIEREAKAKEKSNGAE